MTSTQSYDFVIVGGGTAGSVLASRLSEDGLATVLLLEAGEDKSSDPRVLTPALWTTLLNTDADWAYTTVPQRGFEGRSIACPQGRLLGGSSALNGLAFTASSRSNIDAWAELGNPGWSWDHLSKYLKKSYTLAKPQDSLTDSLTSYIDAEVHSSSGPLQLSVPEQPESQWPKIWLDTLRTLGFPSTQDPFSGDSHGAYLNAETIDPVKRQRSCAANTYLAAAAARDRVTVITGAQVNKIVLDNSNAAEIRAVGVEYTKDGSTVEASTHGQVIVAAGTFNSPRLLELSGIGKAELLKQHQIPCVIDNPNVGENLQNHVMCGLSFEVKDGITTMDPLARQEQSALAAAMDAYSRQTGPFASGGTFASAQLPMPDIDSTSGKDDLDRFLKNPVATSTTGQEFSTAHEDFVRSILNSPTEASGCYVSFPGYATLNPDGSMGQAPEGTENYFTIAALLCHPLSRGSVHLSSGQSSAPPIIDPNYLSNPVDIEVLARHLRFIDGELVRAAPLSDMLKPDGKRNANAPAHFDTLDTAREYIRKTAVGAHHFTGTCSMMPQHMGGVVDSNLRVYGCKNLRVCDASIMPLTPRTNPQATVYALAERAADLIKEGQ